MVLLIDSAGQHRLHSETSDGQASEQNGFDAFELLANVIGVDYMLT